MASQTKPVKTITTNLIGSANSQADFRTRLFKEFSRFDFAIGTDKQLHVFIAGRYVPADLDWIRTTAMGFVTQNMTGHITPTCLHCIEGLLRSNRPKLLSRPPSGLINTLSGILDPLTLTLTPTTAANWLSTVQIPLPWTPPALCPTIDSLLSTIFLEDSIDFIWELWGSFLIPNTFSQHMIWLTGSGGNGKGTCIKLWARSLGAHAFPMPLKTLTSNRFALADIEGKLLIYDPDTPMEDIRTSEVLKQVSGHDTLRAERKGQPSFLFDPFAKMIFGANTDPTSLDFSQGMLDRWLLIPCDRRIRGSEMERTDQDAFIAELLECDGPGALVKAVAGLARLLKRGKFLLPPSIQAKTASYAQTANPLQDFFAEHLDLAPGIRTEWPAFRQVYESWCSSNRRKPATNREIQNWLKRTHPAVEIHRRNRTTNKGTTILHGIGLLDS